MKVTLGELTRRIQTQTGKSDALLPEHLPLVYEIIKPFSAVRPLDDSGRYVLELDDYQAWLAAAIVIALSPQRTVFVHALISKSGVLVPKLVPSGIGSDDLNWQVLIKSGEFTALNYSFDEEPRGAGSRAGIAVDEIVPPAVDASKGILLKALTKYSNLALESALAFSYADLTTFVAVYWPRMWGDPKRPGQYVVVASQDEARPVGTIIPDIPA